MYLRKAILSNNVFTSYSPFQSVHETLIFSNIITGNYQTTVDYGNTYCSFTYNLLVNAFSAPGVASYNTTANNIENVALFDIFGTNTPESTKYVLAADSPGKGAGADGTETGIYGGARPAKEHRLPSIPQITEFTVAGASNPDGTLKVNITVEAQDE